MLLGNIQKGIKGFMCVPLAERFWSKVDSSADCWIWLGAKRSKAKGRDYGMVWVNGSCRPAAQVAWELANRMPFPHGMDACHTCDNPPCVRPDHIFPGTAVDNARDALIKGRLVIYHPPIQERCSKGHPFAGENLYISPSGHRYCRICKRQLKRDWDEARRALEAKP